MANNTEEIILNVDVGNPYYVGARAYVTQTENGAILTVIDKEGTTTAVILNGAKGDTGDTGATGATGATGNGISTATLNDDYTLTLLYTDGTSTTTAPIRGERGNSIQSVEKTGTDGLVDEYTITFDDETTNTFYITNGERGYCVISLETRPMSIPSPRPYEDAYSTLYVSYILENSEIDKVLVGDMIIAYPPSASKRDEGTLCLYKVLVVDNGLAYLSAFEVISPKRGFSVLKVATQPTAASHTTLPVSYKLSKSTVLSESGADRVLVGDTILATYTFLSKPRSNLYQVLLVDSSNVYLSNAVSIKGETGDAGYIDFEIDTDESSETFGHLLFEHNASTEVDFSVDRTNGHLEMEVL